MVGYREVVGKLKENIFLCFLIASGFLCVSCHDDVETTEEYPDWENFNKVEFAKIAANADELISKGDKSWKKFITYTKNDTAYTTTDDYVYVHVLEQGTGSGCPIYTDSIKMHYRGKLLPSTSYPDGYVFDKTFSGDIFDASISSAVKFAVSGLITGVTTAVQNMHIGDHWVIYIPAKLGYGSTGTTGVPAYSMLIFESQLDSYYRVGQKVTSNR